MNYSKVKLTVREKTLTKTIKHNALDIINTFKSLSFSPHSIEKMLLREINIPTLERLKIGHIEEVTLIKGRLKRITINIPNSKITYNSYVVSREGNLISCYSRRKGL